MAVIALAILSILMCLGLAERVTRWLGYNTREGKGVRILATVISLGMASRTPEIYATRYYKTLRTATANENCEQKERKRKGGNGQSTRCSVQRDGKKEEEARKQKET
jgi:hypothetical protein